MISPMRSIQMVLADDDLDDQYMLRKAVEQTQYNVKLKCLDSAEELLDYLNFTIANDRKGLPDLVLLDLNMPGMGGKVALKKIRDSEKMNTIPIVVYTTSNSQLDIDEAYSTGANTVIVKPGTYSEMIGMAKSLCDYWIGVARTSHKLI